jgi:hypothetical protein
MISCSAIPEGSLEKPSGGVKEYLAETRATARETVSVTGFNFTNFGIYFVASTFRVLTATAKYVL